MKIPGTTYWLLFFCLITYHAAFSEIKRSSVHSIIIDVNDYTYINSPIIVFDEINKKYKLWVSGENSLMYKEALNVNELKAVDWQLDFNDVYDGLSNVIRFNHHYYLYYSGYQSKEKTERTGIIVAESQNGFYYNNLNTLSIDSNITDLYSPSVVHAPDGFFYMVLSEQTENGFHTHIIRSTNPIFPKETTVHVKTYLHSSSILGSSHLDMAYITGRNEFVLISNISEPNEFRVKLIHLDDIFKIKKFTFFSSKDNVSFHGKVSVLKNTEGHIYPYTYDNRNLIVFIVCGSNTNAGYIKYLLFSDEDPTNIEKKLVLNIALPGDIPLNGDIDGDSKKDIILFRPGHCDWYYQLSSENFEQTTQVSWGIANDRPFVFDYNGDHKDEIITWRPINGCWYIRYKGSFENGEYDIIHWGYHNDIPVPGDYDQDGKIELAFWRPENGKWYILYEGLWPNCRYEKIQWGTSIDFPLTGCDFNRDGMIDLNLWRVTDFSQHINFRDGDKKIITN